ncbi:hypothetical protein, partial [Pectobacterium brasiliense]|uniref:hypothetical protein n=1 Tax=Pectobacterium brasiliense TaxID=180957 RepID=UPI0019693A0D
MSASIDTRANPIQVQVRADVHKPMDFSPSPSARVSIHSIGDITNSPIDAFRINPNQTDNKQKTSVLPITVDDIYKEKNTDNFIKMLDSIESINSPAAEAFKANPDKLNEAFNAFDDIAFSTLPSDILDRELNEEGEAIKNLLAFLKPRITSEDDKKIFDKIVNSLKENKGKKGYNADSKLSQLVSCYGGDACNDISTKYYKLCTDAHARHHPDAERSHDVIFTEQAERFYGASRDCVGTLTSCKGDDWRAMGEAFTRFRDCTVSLSKALRHCEQKKERVPDPGYPAVKPPDAEQRTRMQGDGVSGIMFSPVINNNGGNSSISGNNSSSSGDNNHPGLVNNRGMDWNAAFDSALTKGDLTKEDRVNLLGDIIKAASPYAFMKESGGVLPNLLRVSAYAPESMDRNPSTQNNSTSPHDTSTGNDATASLAGMPAGAASQTLDGLGQTAGAGIPVGVSPSNRTENAGQSSTGSAATSAAGALVGTASQQRNVSLPIELEKKLATRRLLSVADVEDIEAKLAENRQRHLDNPSSGDSLLDLSGSGQAAEQLDTNAASASVAGGRSRAVSQTLDGLGQTAGAGIPVGVSPSNRTENAGQ